MLAVRDLMRTQVVSVTPELTLRDLVDLLAREHLSGAPVRSGERLVGVVSASDVLSFLASEPPVPEDHPDYVEQGEQAPALSWDEGAEAPSAYFTDVWEDVPEELPERFRRVDSAEWDLLEEHTVEEAMSRGLATVAPDTPAVDAARMMLAKSLHRLVVVDQGELVGILTTTDLVRAIADAQLRPVRRRRRQSGGANRLPK